MHKNARNAIAILICVGAIVGYSAIKTPTQEKELSNIKEQATVSMDAIDNKLDSLNDDKLDKSNNTVDVASNKTHKVNKTDKPSINKPVDTTKPSTNKPVVDSKPNTDKPVTENKPVVDKPVVDEKPNTEKPSTDKPVEKPNTDTEKPNTDTNKPVEKPVEKPSTDKPVTENKPSTSNPVDSDFYSFKQEVLNLVNIERAKQGLNPLVMDDSLLSKCADAKAKDMVVNKYFDHNSPVYGSPFDMMRQFGVKFSTAGENIAQGQATPQQVMNSWMNSSGHRANILNPNFKKLGVGIYKDSNGRLSWVQQFIG